MRHEPTSNVSWTKVCYGIDYNADVINIVKAERNGRKVSVQTISYDEKELAKGVVCGAAVAAGIPVGQAIATTISAPFNSISKARRVFPTLLDIQLPFPLEDCLYNFTETQNASSQRSNSKDKSSNEDSYTDTRISKSIETLAIAARRTDIEKRLTVLADKGIDPHVLDYEGIALWTQLLHEFPNQKESSIKDAPFKIVVFLRGKECIITIGRGNTFLNAHKFKTENSANLDRYLQVQFNKLKESESNCRPEIEWFWAGSTNVIDPNSSNLKSHISKRWVGKSTTVDDPETFLARAYAIRVLLPGPRRTNLRTDNLTHKDAILHQHNTNNRTVLIYLLAGLILCCASAAWMYYTTIQHNDFKKQYNNRITRILGYTPTARGKDLLRIAEDELQTITDQQKPLTEMFQPSLLIPIQKTVTTANHHDIKIEQFKLDRQQMQIKGTSPNLENIKSLQSALNSIGYPLDLNTQTAQKSGNQIFILSSNSGGAE